MIEALFALGAIIIVVFLIFWFLALGLWIWQMVRLSKQENKTSLWTILAVGLASNILGFLVGWFLWGWAMPIGMIGGTLAAGIIGLFLGREKEQEKETHFWCSVCNIKYKEEFLGGETAHEGKICRSCLGKRQRGETASPPPNQTQSPSQNQINPEYEPKNKQWENERSRSEKRILLRELGRKKSKKNSYLTQFIINLAVGQWLLPLITYLIYWITLKEQMKVQSLNNPGAGLATEISFKTIVKDFFKILTSETYVYGGHNIQISLIWKLGIILAFLLPLGLWIYNLVRFLSVNGEVKQLESEIKEIE